MKTSPIIDTRRELVLLVDFKNCNPQGDPDDENSPRTDAETRRGLITSSGLKRKIRDLWELWGQEIYITRGNCLQHTNNDLAVATNCADIFAAISDPEEADPDKEKPKKGKAPPKKKVSKEEREAAEKVVYPAMCEKFIDVRLFGGFIPKFRDRRRGPIQVSMGESVDPIDVDRMAITSVVVANDSQDKAQKGMNRGMGRLARISYGLYRFHIYVNPSDAKRTGASEADYELFLRALQEMFENDRSSVRQGCVRAIYEFRHNTREADAGALSGDRLLDSIQVRLKSSDKPPQAFSDYEVRIPKEVHVSPDWAFRNILTEKHDPSKWNYDT